MEILLNHLYVNGKKINKLFIKNLRVSRKGLNKIFYGMSSHNYNMTYQNTLLNTYRSKREISEINKKSDNIKDIFGRMNESLDNISNTFSDIDVMFVNFNKTKPHPENDFKENRPSNVPGFNKPEPRLSAAGKGLNAVRKLNDMR